MAEIITNPYETLIEVGKENSELHEEVFRLQTEIDRYRTALQSLVGYPGPASIVAQNALANRINAT